MIRKDSSNHESVKIRCDAEDRPRYFHVNQIFLSRDKFFSYLMLTDAKDRSSFFSNIRLKPAREIFSPNAEDFKH